MANLFELTDVWNDADQAFDGIKLNVTDTASADGSDLLDLQIGGSSRFRVRKDGRLIGSTSFLEGFVGIQHQHIGITSVEDQLEDGYFQLFRDSEGNFRFYVKEGGVAIEVGGGGGGGSVNEADNFNWTGVHTFTQPIRPLAESEVDLGVSADPFNVAYLNAVSFGELDDTVLQRDAAGELSLRAGVQDQAFHLYKTYTDASNFERLNVYCDGAAWQIAPYAEGTGVRRNITIGSQATGSGNCTTILDSGGGGGTHETDIRAGGLLGLKINNFQTVIYDVSGNQVWFKSNEFYPLVNTTKCGRSASPWAEVHSLAFHGGKINQGTSSTADPSTTEYPNSGDWGIHKNTTSGEVTLAYNDGGSIVAVALT